MRSYEIQLTTVQEIRHAFAQIGTQPEVSCEEASEGSHWLVGCSGKGSSQSRILKVRLETQTYGRGTQNRKTVLVGEFGSGNTPFGYPFQFLKELLDMFLRAGGRTLGEIWHDQSGYDKVMSHLTRINATFPEGSPKYVIDE